jgi:hypothetical protein
VKAQRVAVALLWPWKGRQWRFPVEVRLTRVAPRKLDDDNLASACKGVRDEVAAMLGVDDGDERLVRFSYGQERGEWGARIAVYEAGERIQAEERNAGVRP